MLLAVVVDWTFTPGGLNFYAHLLFCMLNFCGWSQPRNYFNSEIFPLCVINYVYHVRLHTVHVCVQHHVRLHMCIHLYVCATFDLKHICIQLLGCAKWKVACKPLSHTCCLRYLVVLQYVSIEREGLGDFVTCSKCGSMI